jgi:hypothetical protein
MPKNFETPHIPIPNVPGSAERAPDASAAQLEAMLQPFDQENVSLVQGEVRPAADILEEGSSTPQKTEASQESETTATAGGAGSSGGDKGGDKGGSNNEDPETPDDNNDEPEDGDAREPGEPQVPQYAQLEVRESRPREVEGYQLLGNLTDTVRQLGERISQEVVVVGSSAMREALGEGTRSPQDLDLSTSREVMTTLAQRGEWEEKRLPNGKTLLTNGQVEIGDGWGKGQSYEGLKERSWQTLDGVNVASLPDVFAYKDMRGDEKDLRDLEEIRTRLKDTAAPPPPDYVTAREAAIVRQCLPPEMRDDPDLESYIQLAANGLITVRTCYGVPELGTTHPIVGDLEHPDYKVRAFYHNGHGLPGDMRALVEHFDTVNARNKAAGQPPTFSRQDYANAVATATWADAEYGNGRESDWVEAGRQNLRPAENSPGGHDERRSARLYHARALSHGIDPANAQVGYAMVDNTAFNEKTGAQRGRYSDDPRVRALCAVDLSPLSTSAGPRDGMDLMPEDLLSARWSPLRPLGRIAAREGITLRSAHEARAFIDDNPGARLPDMPAGLTLKGAALGRLKGNAGFTDNGGYHYPDDWTGEDPYRRHENAELYREIIRRGELDPTNPQALTIQQAYEMTREYEERYA